LGGDGFEMFTFLLHFSRATSTHGHQNGLLIETWLRLALLLLYLPPPLVFRPPLVCLNQPPVDPLLMDVMVESLNPLSLPSSFS